MLKEQFSFQEVLKKLTSGNTITLTFDRSDIVIRFVEDASKLSLSTPVYRGGNYIPHSVRHSLSHRFSFAHPAIKTFLSVDEEAFKIHLHYSGDAEFITQHQFNEIVEEFGSIAENWRLFLDEKDRNDLVYVHAKK